MFNRIVTGDQSCEHHYQPESKRASVQLKHPSSPFRSNKNFNVTSSAEKVMLIVFWNSHGVLLAHFEKRGENVNCASYCKFLLRLLDGIRRKSTGQLARVLPHQDNARPHTILAINLMINSRDAKAMIRHLWKAVEFHEQHHNKIQRESTN
jgi:hypothetical protein